MNVSPLGNTHQLLRLEFRISEGFGILHAIWGTIWLELRLLLLILLPHETDLAHKEENAASGQTHQLLRIRVSA
jgi:hypothetical protein